MAVAEARAVTVVADGALAVARVAGGALVADAMFHPRCATHSTIHRDTSAGPPGACAAAH